MSGSAGDEGTFHTVEQNECVSSIADDNGLYWETIWNHSENAALTSQQ